MRTDCDQRQTTTGLCRWLGGRSGGWFAAAAGAAWLALAASPAAADFTDIAFDAGVALRDVRGAAWADYDEDGCVDLLVTLIPGIALLRNACDGSGKFNNVTADAGMSGPTEAWDCGLGRL